MKKKFLSGNWKAVIQGLPLAEVVVNPFLPTIKWLGQQMSVLIVMLWIQAFFIIGYFLTKN